MAKKIRGVEENQELAAATYRPDVRTLSQRASEFFNSTDGVIAMAMALPILAIILIKLPFSGEALLLSMWIFKKIYVDYGKEKRFDFPFRVPFTAKLLDGSQARRSLGNGISFLGKEISTNLEIWSGDSDLRTHLLILGTTGSGKTEFLLGLVYNALVQNSGFIYTDGKGDVALFNNIFRLARYLGREDDLVVINFLTSGRDFLDKQKDRTTNTMNPFALGSSGMLIELIISLMDDGGSGGDMWKGRAIAFVAAQTRALCFLRDRGYLLLDSNTFIEYFELPVIERLVLDKTINVKGNDIKIEDPIFDTVLKPLHTYLTTLPGYKQTSKGNQEQKTLEQHGYITMQLTRLFGDMSYTYGYLFQTTLGEVDMYDVVINRRILVVLLPALERAPDSLKMLGKLIVGAIKQMMAGCLGNRLEGSVREIVEARPTNAPVPYYVVLDEYGYYAVLGFAVAPAQARSLGFAQPKSARLATPTGWKLMGEMEVGTEVCTPDGVGARVLEVLPFGATETYQVMLADGRNTRSTEDHLWSVWRSDEERYHIVSTSKLAWWVGKGIRCSIAMPHPDAVAMAGTSGERAARLASLLDGNELPIGECRYLLENEAVAREVLDLARSLGMSAAIAERADGFLVTVNAHASEGRIPVLSVTPTGWEETQCIRIDHPEQLYITDEYVVTHNCITFAAQDFSSLQKASKEEADATWENTNVRGIGRITSGKESETYRRIVGVSGETSVFQGGSKEFGHGISGEGYKANRDVRVEKVNRIEYDDLAEQQDGEFTFLVGKKKSGGRGGVRVIRARGFYTQVDEKPTEIRVNHFLKVEPPRRGNADEEIAVQDQLEIGLRELLVKGRLAEVFPDVQTAQVGNKQPTLLFATSQYLREAQSRHRLSPADAIRVALLCCEREIDVAQNSKLKEIAKSTQGAVDSALSESSTALRDALVSEIDGIGAPTVPEISDTPEIEIPDIPEMPNISAIAETPSTSSVPEFGELPDFDLPDIAATKKKVDTDEGGSGDSKQGAAGGGMTLIPRTSEAKDESVFSLVSGFLDDPVGLPVSVEPGSFTTKDRVQVNLLTLQEVGADEVPDQLSCYLEDTIADADVLIGTTRDSLSIKAEAEKTVQRMKEKTSYIDGVVPEVVTLESYDKVLEGLVDAAERNMSSFLD